MVFDTATGELLWSLKGAQAQGLKPLSTRICKGRVYFEQRGSLCCCNLRSGESIWTQQADPLRTLSSDALICVSKRNITLLSPEDGSKRWTQPVSLSSVRDVLLVNGSLWMGGGRPYDTGNAKHTGPLWGPYFAVQRDLQTGKIVKEITAENPKHHHRCYENKATPNYILGGRRGTEVLDLESGDCLWNSWAHGTCRYGVMPCNGMIYIPPNACGCYVTVKLMGFNALAPDSQGGPDLKIEDPVERGPAFAAGAAVATQDQWPTFRGDSQRSGRAASPIEASVSPLWQASLKGDITAPTISATAVYVAVPDQHAVCALDAKTGKTRWTYIADGRVDSPPTIANGRVYFGCRDGCVYVVDDASGQLVWRFRAARAWRRIVADGQVESAGPIHGSVLVHQGSVYFVAGRSSFLDGGLTLYRLDAKTGQVLASKEIYSPDPETGQQPEQYGPSSMPGPDRIFWHRTANTSICGI